MLVRTRATLLGAAAFCLLAAPLVGQTWSSDQMAVLAVVEATWTENDATWVTRLTHPEMLGWSNTNPVPRDQTTTGRWRSGASPSAMAICRSERCRHAARCGRAGGKSIYNEQPLKGLPPTVCNSPMVRYSISIW